MIKIEYYRIELISFSYKSNVKTTANFTKLIEVYKLMYQ